MDGDDFDHWITRSGGESIPEWIIIKFADAENEMGDWVGKRAVFTRGFHDSTDRAVSGIPSGDSSIGGPVLICCLAWMDTLFEFKTVYQGRLATWDFLPFEHYFSQQYRGTKNDLL